MPTDRLTAFRDMLAVQPDNAKYRFGLANELLKALRFEEAADELAKYLQQADDEGNGWLRYAEALRACDRIDECRAAIAKGIDAATRHNHATLVSELRNLEQELDE